MESTCCSCDFFEPIELYQHFDRKARKDHECDECGKVIKNGESYHVHQGRCDGRWIYVKNCEQCESIRDDYGCGCIGDLDQVVFECLGTRINGLPED